MKLTPTFRYASRFFIVIVAAGLATAACTDNSGNGQGNPGAGGSSGGGAGTTGSGGNAGTTGSGGTAAGGSGGTTPGFMSVLPCMAESDYVPAAAASDGGAPTVNFGFINGALTYDPKCLKVTAGTTVTFSGDFGTHPLSPSGHRGAQTGNPITLTSSVPDGGTTKDFTFTTPGFYAYFCTEHDTLDTGNFMDGVIWVQ